MVARGKITITHGTSKERTIVPNDTDDNQCEEQKNTMKDAVVKKVFVLAAVAAMAEKYENKKILFSLFNL